MSDFISLFSKNDGETKVLIRSKPLILCLLAVCYLLLIYCFGFVFATVMAPIVGLAFGMCNRKLAIHKA